MDAKSNPFRFTLLFNRNDARHQRAVEILNQQGKSKSQYIVTALLHYVECTKQPVEQAASCDLAEIADRIIRETAERVLAGISRQPAAGKIAVSAAVPQTSTASFEVEGAPQMDSDYDLLKGSLGAFRGRK